MSAPASTAVLPSGTSESLTGPSSGSLPAPSAVPTELFGTSPAAPAAVSAHPPTAARAAPATPTASQSHPPAGAPLMSEAAPPAKRIRTAEELAEIRRQKGRLVVHQPEAPAASTASTPAAEPSIGHCTPATASKQKRVRKVVNPTDQVARAAAAAKSAAQPLGPTKKAPGRARSTPTSTTTVSGAALPPSAATTSNFVALPPAVRPGVLALSVDCGSDSDSDDEGLLPNVFPLLYPGARADVPNSRPDLQPTGPDPLPAPVMTQPGSDRDTGRTQFNLTNFLSRFHGGLQGAPPASAVRSSGPLHGNPSSSLEHLQHTVSADTREQAAQLDSRASSLLADFAQALHQQPAPAAAPDSAALLNWTVPNSRGACPPAAICELRAAHFPPPAAIYILTAHRLYSCLLTPEGLHETPLSFVMRWRIVASMTFNDSPPS
ncbi:hypothetical protein PF008_g765 [Phytophthora fragariae]|uniref:Uncharacterized protein n=1 Tax=Phytophthora fragariae TaxID=53985 RepID=A0A6G0SM24_9STRA|nr:hypothetical protein PF008_g765 [Phytophthora fragariae]